MDDGGYERPEFWLSDGWYARSRNGWTAPLYWESTAGGRQVFTLEGMRGLDLDEPVCHVSYYEADAFARWAGARLPTEAEWETSAMAPGVALEGNFLESGRFHPARPMDARETPPRTSPMQLYGDVWEWTQSPYTPYRGFRPAAGRSASTTASSCATSLFCGAVRAARRDRTSGPLTATSSPPRRAGSSRASGWLATSDRCRQTRHHRALSNGSSGNDRAGRAAMETRATRC